MNNIEPPVSPPVKPSRTYSIPLILLTCLLVILLAFGTFALAGLLRPFGWGLVESGEKNALTFDADPETETALNRLREVLNVIDRDYYQELSDAQMIDAMTKGVLSGLGNRYTFYLTAEQNQLMQESLSGNYSGIGCFVSLNRDGAIEVTEVIKDGPADQAGIRPGDRFLTVDGKNVSEFKDINELAVLVRGEENSTVVLTLARPGQSAAITVTVTRKRITTASIAHRMLSDGIGYVLIREFSSGSSRNFIAAMDDLQHQGARQVVFDLRNNSGGLAGEVIAMLDYLLPDVTIASLKGRKDGREFTQEWRSDRRMGVPASMNYVCLVNHMTASASELFSGSLRDHGKAVLIGLQTFGKGSGTLTIPLQDGAAANVTNFLYYLPNGASIEGSGLIPDRVIELPESALGKSIASLGGDDTQLTAATDWLRANPPRE